VERSAAGIKIKKFSSTAKFINKPANKAIMKTVTIPEAEYKTLKKKAGLDEDLLMKLIGGLEDIKAGRIKPWKSKFTD